MEIFQNVLRRRGKVSTYIISQSPDFKPPIVIPRSSFSPFLFNQVRSAKIFIEKAKMGWGFQWINIPPPYLHFFEHAQKRGQSAKKKEKGQSFGFIASTDLQVEERDCETNRKSPPLLFFRTLPQSSGLCPARVWLNGCTQDRNAVTARPPPPCVLKRREGSFPLFIFRETKPLERLVRRRRQA